MPNRKGGCTPKVVSKRARYVVRAGDFGGKIYVAVRALNAHGWSRYVVSANRIGPIASRGTPVSLAPPYASGTVAPARLVSTTEGRWSGPVSGYRYQWFQCDLSFAGCSEAHPINSATDSSYVINPRFLGDYLYVTVTAYNRYGSATPVKSNLIGPIAGTPQVPPFSEEVPLIQGRATVGSTLRVEVGDWDGLPEAWSYQWLHCTPRTMICRRIGGQNGPSYVVQGDVLGEMIRVGVTARNAAGWSEMVLSGAIGPVTR